LAEDGNDKTVFSVTFRIGKLFGNFQAVLFIRKQKIYTNKKCKYWTSAIQIYS